MDRKQDKRNLSTKIKLASAFKELSKQKQINKISVSDLIKYCNLNRNTFYYHFEDIYDLINWIFSEEIKTIIEDIDKSNYETFLNDLFDYIEENKHILASAYNSLGREQLIKTLHPYFYITLDTIITNRINEEQLSINTDFKNFLIDFYTGGIAKLIVSYCKGEQKLERKTFINYLISLTNSIPIK